MVEIDVSYHEKSAYLVVAGDHEIKAQKIKITVPPCELGDRSLQNIDHAALNVVVHLLAYVTGALRIASFGDRSSHCLGCLHL